VVHPTYKHLEGKLRFGSFSLGQWAQITTAALVAVVFGVYVSPFGTGVTVFVSILAAGLPVAVAYGAMGLEFSVGQFVAAAWRYWRSPRRYLPGPGSSAIGYVVRAPTRAGGRQTLPTEGAGLAGEVEALWDC
jgi:hypothetical protein